MILWWNFMHEFDCTQFVQPGTRLKPNEVMQINNNNPIATPENTTSTTSTTTTIVPPSISISNSTLPVSGINLGKTNSTLPQ